MEVQICLQNADSTGSTIKVPKVCCWQAALRRLQQHPWPTAPTTNNYHLTLLLFFGLTCLEDECKINLVWPSCTPALPKIYEARFLQGKEGLSISNVSFGGRKMYLSCRGILALKNRRQIWHLGLKIVVATVWTNVAVQWKCLHHRRSGVRFYVSSSFRWKISNGRPSRIKPREYRWARVHSLSDMGAEDGDELIATWGSCCV